MRPAFLEVLERVECAVDPLPGFERVDFLHDGLCVGAVACERGGRQDELAEPGGDRA
jgi:hypothetical protein